MTKVYKTVGRLRGVTDGVATVGHWPRPAMFKVTPAMQEELEAGQGAASWDKSVTWYWDDGCRLRYMEIWQDTERDGMLAQALFRAIGVEYQNKAQEGKVVTFGSDPDEEERPMTDDEYQDFLKWKATQFLHESKTDWNSDKAADLVYRQVEGLEKDRNHLEWLYHQRGELATERQKEELEDRISYELGRYLERRETVGTTAMLAGMMLFPVRLGDREEDQIMKRNVAFRRPQL